MVSADEPASRSDEETWQQVDACVQRFEEAWRNSGRPAIDDFLPRDGPHRLAVLIELVQVDLERRLRVGEPARAKDYEDRYPELAAAPPPSTYPTPDLDSPQPKPVTAGTTAHPPRIGRYRVLRTLGEGGFGIVYLGHDDQLSRPIAIKVPHAKLVAQPEDAEAYLTEARTVANLDHPNIVPVHDVGSTEHYPCYIVSKFIEGSTLSQKIKEDRPWCGEASELVATIAEALHYAHRKGLVHRDIKPGNIIIDESGKPFVLDFGLALKEDKIDQGPKYAGTPAYMSPEQARGEGHRVDGRSDIFSLGVVFYELLVGRRPFRSDSQIELLEQVTNHEPRPLRQFDDGIPKELERICFKALSKRASERYMTAKDMADDLRHFLDQSTQVEKLGREVRVPVSAPLGSAPLASPVPMPSTTPAADTRPIKIMPKGLRSFDAHDADFFLELLPGPRDRNGLPDSIRFWKTRIEETDADNSFAVGLIYGPSGSGKSSLVKAGLLPRLSDDVIAVYLEATANETETRLLNGLRKRCPALPANQGVREMLVALRRGQGLPKGKKVLIVLDQFEQWLHARKEENTELVEALRQCDGGRVQAIVMVRDDFWMAATRFMRELEIRLLEGQNSAAVDLFPIRHAEKVLAAFGRAFGALPDNANETIEQKQFLEQAVSGLAPEGKVICVRLALFAEMMKGKAWTPASLKAVGGAAGVGVTFLDETFSTAGAPPEHRLHQKAARALLKALLPESGTDIRGHMRSYKELLAASGYANHQEDFGDLIRVLDSEIRLITPTEPEGPASSEGRMASDEKKISDSFLAPRPSALATRYYQLTHDFLVHSLRGWLTRKQKETRRGRAELLLADRAGVWSARPENRQLPSLAQWFQIRWLTQKKNWTPPQRTMMRKAARIHAARGLVLILVLAALSAAGLMVRNKLHAAGLVRTLLNAETSQVPGIVADMEGYRNWTDSLLKVEYQRAKPNSRKQLHVSLALLPVDKTQVDYLYGRLLDAKPHEVPVIRDALARHRAELAGRLWAVVAKPEKGKEQQRLRAGAALATYEPESRQWDKHSGKIAADLVAENALDLGLWSEAFRSVQARLVAPLSDIFRDRQPERTAERTLATNLLADYAAGQPNVLADLLMDADEKQFVVIYPKFEQKSERGLPVLTAELDRKLPPNAKDEAKERLAKRQANAAVALLKLGQASKVWPLLKHGPDPRMRSYLIHRLGPMRADASAIIKRLDEEPDVTIRRALVLSLGEFGVNELPPAERALLMDKLREMYRHDPDPGLHGAAEWLLRQSKQEQWLEQMDEAWAKDKKRQAQTLERIRWELAHEKGAAKPQWYVNGQGQTMVVIAGPAEVVMGSPLSEKARAHDESQPRKSIGRSFAIAAKPVTVADFKRKEAFVLPLDHAPAADCPVIAKSWCDAAAYCNWLSANEGIPRDQWCYETLEGMLGPTHLIGQSFGAQALTPAGVPMGALTQHISALKVTELYEFAGVRKMKDNYLSLTGYRLPTESEWKYACRAGAVTNRFYGESEELLGKYAWYLKNSEDRSWPVGSKKPNDLGLFDMHGNVWNWCQDREMRKESDAIETDLSINPLEKRILRGGAYFVRAAWVGLGPGTGASDFPTLRVSQGFRTARTISISAEP